MALGKTALGIGLTAAFGMGAANIIGPSAREAAMDTAFGDPNADAAFLGRNVSARFLLGSAMGGFAGGALQMSAPQDQFMVDPMRPTAVNTGILGVAGAAAGLYVGRKAGGAASRAARQALGKPKNNVVSRMLKTNAGLKGAIIGGAVGMGVGAMTGAFAMPLGYVGAHARRNQDYYSQSPYNANNVSRANAEMLNASGDIVLGMFNSR